MRRSSRRGSSGRWFPTAQSNAGTVVTATVGSSPSFLNFQPIIADGLDEPANEENLTGPAGLLGATLTTSYLIKRILGSIFVAPAADNEDATLAVGVLAAAAIFVDSVDNQGQLLNGAAWDPLDDDSAQKSWMWRRVWTLGNIPTAGFPGFYRFPFSNAEYGSVREGTHVDVKSRRNVGYEQRLFLVQAARSLTGSSGLSVYFNTNLRMFARMVQRT